MNRIFILIIILLSIASVHAQELEVVNVVQSECDINTDIRTIQPRIITQSFKNGTFSIKIGTIANCSGIHNVRANHTNDTLFIEYEHGNRIIDTLREESKIEEDQSKDKTKTIVTRELVEMSSCNCCFEFQFEIWGLINEPCNVIINDSEFIHYHNKHKILPFMFKVVNGDTINRIDNNGWKQGKWDTIYFDRKLDFFQNTKNCLFNISYRDNKAEIAEAMKFYPNGKLEWKVVFHNYKVYKSEKYNKKGKLIRNKKMLTNESNSLIR